MFLPLGVLFNIAGVVGSILEAGMFTPRSVALSVGVLQARSASMRV